MQAESPTLENRQEWGTQNSKQRPGHPSEKILNLSISLLLVRLIIRVEVEAVDRPISFPMGTTVCLLRDQGAWRLFHEPTSVLFHTDGRGMPIPEKEAPGTRCILMKLEEWPGGRHKKGDDDDRTHCSFFRPCEKSI